MRLASFALLLFAGLAATAKAGSLELDGVMKQGGVVYGKTDPGVALELSSATGEVNPLTPASRDKFSPPPFHRSCQNKSP